MTMLEASTPPSGPTPPAPPHSGLVGRGRERVLLAGALETPGPGLVWVTGPRGTGKTALVATALHGRGGLHFQGGEWTTEDLLADLRGLAEARIGAVPTPRRPGVLPLGPGRGAWLALLLGILEHASGTRAPFVLALDGLEGMVAAHRRLAADLEEVLDAADTRGVPLTLLLVARSASWAEEFEGSFERPPTVKGRVALGSVPYRAAGWAHGARTPRDAFLRWALLGDLPERLPRGGSGMEAETVEEAVVRRVLSRDGDLYEAPLRRLKATFRRPARYGAILRALARGPLDWSAVLRHARGIDQGAQLAPYLRGLEDEGLMRVDLPLDAAPGSRSRRYLPGDPFLGFWFGWVLPHRSLLSTLGPREVWRRHIRPDLAPHLQGAMEEATRRWMLEHAEEAFGVPAREVGSLWGAEADFPAAGMLANGQVCYALVDWGGRRSGMPTEMAERMRDTRYGIGRQARVPIYVLPEDPGEPMRRAAARDPLHRIVTLEELMGAGPPHAGGSTPAPPRGRGSPGGRRPRPPRSPAAGGA